MKNLPLLIFLTMSIIFAALGNISIIVMILSRKNLQIPGNYLLLSLAVSDCLVALFAMPPALMASLENERWTGGRAFCAMWIFFDVLSCSSSILNLTMICVDRYRCIVYPLHYLPNRTTKFVFKYYIYSAWAVSLGLAIFPTALGRNFNENKLSCKIEMGDKYQIFAVILSFYLPLFCMMVMYLHIYRIAKKILKQDVFSPSSIANPAPVTMRTPPSTNQIPPNSFPLITNNNNNQNNNNNNNTGSSQHHERIIRIKRRIRWQDWKATITLGVIMLAFIICWLPFFTLTLWEAIWQSTAPRPMGSIFLWLGYFNSLLNPIIYCLLNREFRMNTCFNVES